MPDDDRAAADAAWEAAHARINKGKQEIADGLFDLSQAAWRSRNLDMATIARLRAALAAHHEGVIASRAVPLCHVCGAHLEDTPDVTL